MRALVLLMVLILAKIVTLLGHSIPLSAWSPIAYFWQDVLVALVFLVFDRLCRRAWISWSVYAVIMIYTAFNVGVSRVLSSPLTQQMLHAAGGAMSDSFAHHFTLTNVAAMLAVLIPGAALPYAAHRLQWTRTSPPHAGIAVAVAMVVAGPTASARIDTIGLHRNALMTLVTSRAMDSAVSASSSIRERGRGRGNWRSSPFGDVAPDSSLNFLSGAAEGRNVVLVMLESAGAEYLKQYGAKTDPMPHLTDLTDKSVVFDAAYSVHPESIRALFTVLNGYYPQLKAPPPSIAQSLGDAKYRTALFHSGRFMYLGMDHVVADAGFQVAEDAGEIGGQRESSFGVDEPSSIKRVLSWVDSVPRGERFFVTYLPIAGHHPYDTPQPGPFPEEEESDRYLNALHYADSSLHELIQGFRARGLAENTVFLIAGDHGEAFGQHEGNYGHSLFIYDENVRVPLLIYAPGLIERQIRINRPVSLIDITPTILDLVGIKSNRLSYHGDSLLAGISQMALFSTNYSLSLLGLRDGCWKYSYEQAASRSKLFNLCEDPSEKRDVAEQYPERIEAYRARINDWWIRRHPGVNVRVNPF